MALILNMKLGRSFYVGDLKYTMENVKSQRKFLLREHTPIERVFEVTDLGQSEGKDGVLFSAAESWRRDVGRVMIEAPRDVKILRDNLYEGQDGNR